MNLVACRELEQRIVAAGGPLPQHRELFHRCSTTLDMIDRYDGMGALPAFLGGAAAARWLWGSLIAIAAAIGVPAVVGVARAAPEAAETVVKSASNFVSTVFTGLQWVVIGYAAYAAWQLLPQQRRAGRIKAIQLAEAEITKRRSAEAAAAAKRARADSLKSMGVIDEDEDVEDEG